MKTNKTRAKKLLLSFFTMLVPLLARAHDFYYSGIYFNITSIEDLTVEVTYQGNNSYSYTDEYRGNVVIPQTAIYNNIQYSVTSIKEGAFSNCSNLTSLTIPESVTSIGKEAFMYCKKLENIYITNLAAWCNIEFNGSSSHPLFQAKNLYLNGEIIRNIVIPNTVTEIKEYAFYECNTITSVTIPESVVSIGNSAFAGCGNLSSVVMSDEVSSIGKSAFASCSRLSSINISRKLTSIEEYTFYACRSLNTIYIPNKIAFIGSNAFAECVGLHSVYIDNIESWCNIHFNSGNANPLYNADNLYVNNELIQELELPNSLEVIKDYTFTGCASITTVTIPYGVTIIGKNAFYDCSNLTSVTLSESVIEISDGAFGYCYQLRDIVIPQAVTSIGGNAFSGCSSLTSIEIPENVISIGENAFNGCREISSFNLPNSLRTLGENVFSYTKWYDNQNDGVLYLDNWLVGYKGTMPSKSSIEIMEGTVGMAASTFLRQNNLISIKIPNTIHKIPNNAFFSCLNLAEVCLPTGLKEIGLAAFSSSCLKDVKIPEGVVYIGERAFQYCEKLQKAILPNSLEFIGAYAFSGCTALKGINIPQNLTSIEQGTFYDIAQGKWIIPQSIDSIGTSAFTCIVGQDDDSKCMFSPGYILNPTPPIFTDTYDRKGGTIYVPSESLDLYKEHQYWGRMSKIIGIYVPEENSSISLSSGYYRIRNFNTDGYLTYGEIGEPLSLNNTQSETNILYYNGKNFTTYTSGYYINGITHGMYGEKDDFELTFSKNGTLPAVSIKSKSVGYLCANGSSLISVENPINENCDWIIEPVEDIDIENTDIVSIERKEEVLYIYTIDGKRISEQREGINIVRMKDGSIRKVFVR